jgi:hypothetical protein
MAILQSPGVAVTEKAPSDYISPYVYKATHKLSGKFYFGYRSNNCYNKIKIIDDLGVKYFSSRVV